MRQSTAVSVVIALAISALAWADAKLSPKSADSRAAQVDGGHSLDAAARDADHSIDAGHSPDAGTHVTKRPGEAKLGDETTCPVSGDTFTVEADTPHVDYKGKTYYLCCDDCVEDFKANPKKYLHK